MQQIQIDEMQSGQRLDRFLSKYLSEAGTGFLYKMMRKKNIVLNGKKCEGSEKLKAGDEIKLFFADETIEKFKNPAMKQKPLVVEQEGSLNILYENEHILILNKPAGVLSQKAAASDVSMNEYIRGYLAKKGELPENRVFMPSVCNRLDRNTSGIITAGKTVYGAQRLSEAFKSRDVEKYYLCVVQGVVTDRLKTDGYLIKDEKSNKVKILNHEAPGSEHIVTEYIPVTNNGKYSLLKVRLYTGKPHQIRAHLAFLGHPLAGDYKYGNHFECERLKKAYHISFQLLHSFELNLKKEQLHIFAPMPEYFTRFLEGEKIWVHGRQEDLEALH